MITYVQYKKNLAKHLKKTVQSKPANLKMSLDSGHGMATPWMLVGEINACEEFLQYSMVLPDRAEAVKQLALLIQDEEEFIADAKKQTKDKALGYIVKLDLLTDVVVANAALSFFKREMSQLTKFVK